MTDELCCGMFLYMSGIFDAAEQVAKRLEKQLEIMGVKRMIFICDGCYRVFKELYPNRFGVKFEFESITLRDWLIERIENGKIEIKNKLNMKVTIHDGCHAKLYGTDSLDRTRKLLKELGLEVVEMKHSKENARCCGMGNFASSKDLRRAVKGSMGTYQEAEETGADAIVVTCSSCLWMLSLGKIMSSSKMPIYHIIEIIQKAIGEEPVHKNMERTGEIAKIILEEAPKYLKEIPERYWMKPIVS